MVFFLLLFEFFFRCFVSFILRIFFSFFFLMSATFSHRHHFEMWWCNITETLENTSKYLYINFQFLHEISLRVIVFFVAFIFAAHSHFRSVATFIRCTTCSEFVKKGIRHTAHCLLCSVRPSVVWIRLLTALPVFLDSTHAVAHTHWCVRSLMWNQRAVVITFPAQLLAIRHIQRTPLCYCYRWHCNRCFCC